MPRTTLQIADRIEHLTILDESGKLDPNLEPAIPDDLLLKLYRYMLLGRRFDERMLDLQRQGRIGTFPPHQGAGSIAAWRRILYRSRRLAGAFVSRDHSRIMARQVHGKRSSLLQRLQ